MKNKPPSYTNLTIILLGIVLVIIVFTSFLNKPLAIVNEKDKYFCETDSDCAKYGTCSVGCVNMDWATKNPDPGPYCGLLLPEFDCKCLENKCEAIITDSRFANP